MTSFKDEQNIWVNNIFDKYYLDSWRLNYVQNIPEEKTRSLELFIRGECNLKCKYCYVHKYRDILYPEEIDDFNNALTNTKKIMDWLVQEKLLPSRIEIFGGEAISWQQYEKFFDILQGFFDTLTPDQRKRVVLIAPINVIFLANPKYFALFVDIQKKFYKNGIQFWYSLSLDGKYIDPAARPAVNPNFSYSDAFYELVTKFCRACVLPPQFHPMISKENIKDWKKNFLWYISFIKKTYNLKTAKEAFSYLYLLEVRNAEWSVEERKELENLYTFLIRYTLKKLGGEIDIFKTKILNLFSLFGMTNRGLTCSLQTTLMVRVGDLTTAPCHRLFYPDFLSTQLTFEKNKPFNSLTPYAHLSALMINYRNLAPCSTCEISSLCSGPCLGANYEATRDMFVVPSNVCDMEKSKIYGIVKGLEQSGKLNEIIYILESHVENRNDDYAIYMRTKVRQLKYIREIILKEKQNG